MELLQEETVLAFLEKAAPALGLDKSDAVSLELEFGDTILAHELTLKEAGLGEVVQYMPVKVLGAKERLVAQQLKAKRVDISAAARDGEVALVRLVCKHAPERVNSKTVQVLPLNTRMLLSLLLLRWQSTGSRLCTGLRITTLWRWLSCFWEQEQQWMSKAT